MVFGIAVYYINSEQRPEKRPRSVKSPTRNKAGTSSVGKVGVFAGSGKN